MRKQFVKFLSIILPKVVSNIAYKNIVSPQQHKFREHELKVLDTAHKEQLDFDAFKIQIYTWGNPEHEKILLIHGWEGQAGNFSDLIPVLIEANYHVIAFDAPSHGLSSKGETSLFQFSDLVETMIRKYKCTKLISHSFGGVATTYALYNNPDLHIERYALLTTPDKFTERIDYVAQQVGITNKVKNMLIKRLEKELNVDVSATNVSNFVKAIDVEKAMIIHDKNDRVITIQQSQNVANNWPVCQLKEIEGTGHFRILRTQSVLNEVTQFMN
ncbi:MAG: alpha/beta hydrolase [Saprospiraceae bacterium]|nr:alpha/beta hydrolase [Saprospiraceae bacterium]